MREKTFAIYLKKYRDYEECHEQLHANMLDNKDKIEKDTHKNTTTEALSANLNRYTNSKFCGIILPYAENMFYSH